MLKFISSIAIICIISPTLFAQHINIDKKALFFLASQEKVNIIFVQDSLLMIDDLNEMDFVEKMSTKISRQTNAEEANNWIADYNKDKNSLWQEVFIAQLNEKLGENKNAPRFEMSSKESVYTMKVVPKWMYFGYDAGIIDRPAKVTLQIYFYKTKTPDIVIFSTEISRAMAKYNKKDGDGEGAGPSLNRMRKAYEMAGYKLAKALTRVVN